MTTREKIAEVLKNHNLMHISTVDADGKPKCRGVDYVAGEKESELYFITNKNSNKVREIKHNNNVFVVIDHDCPSMEDLNKLKYLKASGTAEIMESPDEVQNVFAMILRKFPFMRDLPVDPASFVAVRVALEDVTLSDNTVKFGHEEKLGFS